MTAIGNISGRKILVLVMSLYAVVGFLIYSNVIVDGIYLFDDFEYIVGNYMLTDYSHLNLSDPRQVGYMSFTLNFALGGDDPRGYHLVNVLIHLTNAALVYLLVQAILSILAGPGKQGSGGPYRATAFLTGLMFLVHPVQTQAVSYITQRFTSLAALFYLLSVFWYLASRVRFEHNRESRSGYIFYGLSLLSALLAMKTKEIAFTIPFIIATLEFLLFRDSTYSTRRFIYLIPYLALAAVIPLSIFGPELGLIGPGEGIAEITRKEKIYDLTERSWYEYLFTQFRVIVTYVRLLLMPVHQQVIYDYKVSRSLLDMRVVLSLLLLLSIAAFAYRSWKRAASEDPGEAPATKIVSLGILWFFVTISVESSVIPIKDLIFEHRIYLPSVGFFAACSALLAKAVRKASRGAMRPLALGALAAVIAAPLSLATYARNDIWTDEVKFWDDVVQKTPDKAIGYHNRGNAYAKIGQFELALRDINKTIGYFPKFPGEDLGYEGADFTPMNMSKTYMNRAQIYGFLGMADAAAADYAKARALMTLPPIDADTTLKLADMYSKRGAYKHAIAELEKILQWDPDNLEALNNRGNAYSWSSNYQAAINDFSRAVSINPDFTLAYYNRGIAYAWSGDTKNAREDFMKSCDAGFQPACDGLDKLKRGQL